MIEVDGAALASAAFCVVLAITAALVALNLGGDR
jgi:hypothetical protein